MSGKHLQRTWLLTIVIIPACCLSIRCTRTPFKKTADGVVINLKKTPEGARSLRLQIVGEHIIRVTASPRDSFSRNASLMIVPQKHPAPHWSLRRNKDSVILSTAALRAVVSLPEGQITFTDTSGNVLLKEKAGGQSFIADTADGAPGFRIRQIWENTGADALYGLGENQLGLTNILGKDIVMAQHNTEAFVPFFVSTGHYGILWDNNSITRFGDPRPYMPLDSLQLFDAAGRAGGLTATYCEGGGQPPLTREETRIDYKFLGDLKRLPPGFSQAQPASVEWKGYVASPYSGTHRFLLYSGGYIKVWIGGKLLADKWRQSWNPAETLLEVPMEKGRKYPIRVQWIPDGSQSFLSLTWNKPPAAGEKDKISLSSEMGQEIDYYFISGKNIDSLISGYRKLTGKAPIMPLWAYGYWQSREHYDSQKEILDVVKEFRRRRIPLDNIVQDWFYWKKDQWGTQLFDSTRYPDPQGMIDTLHDKDHVHFMISVWPKFYTGTAVFSSFWDKGWLYKKNVEDSTKDWVGYVSTFYDAFNPKARKAFWQLVNTRLFSLGVDAWWLDASEPDINSNTSIATRKQLMDPTALGPSAEYFNAYPLENEEAFYTGQRNVKPNQRVFILTRSAFAGSQRYAAATWSGDIGATWQDMKNQIATGISFSMSGIPYWTMDIGGFATESRYQHPDAAALAEWREQFTRWYQFGAFCPLFRAHGQAPYREPFNVAPEGSPAYRSILYYDRLRYRLMPYIYSVAGAVWLHNYTMMRGLAMDFPADSTARNLTDEYLFGPDVLVNPVYTYGARTKLVYLPAEAPGDGGWYNLYDGNYSPGGRTIAAAAPYTRMPVFVKAGAIVPMGPPMQYTGQKPADTLILYVYTGRNGRFELYEDGGVNYDYEKGAFSLIPLSYSQRDHSLRIGPTKGSFPGMQANRVFLIRWVSPDRPVGVDSHTAADKTVSYAGRQITVTM
jgi:alpha-D-xyloside xylohydrolase